jgi:dynein heavy chain
MTPDLEAAFLSLLNGKVPRTWLAVSYRSRKPVASYVTDLVARCTMFSQWIATGTPREFWLPGFSHTQAFLTAVLQDHARRTSTAIDVLALDFECLAGGAAPSGAVVINGLFLEVWSCCWAGRLLLKEQTVGEVDGLGVGGGGGGRRRGGCWVGL